MSIERKSYISIEFANQLAIPESDIVEKLDPWKKKQYSISNLQLNVGDYADVSQFVVKSVWRGDGDVILGLAWIETLETFTLNAENKFLTFSYKKKKLKLHDATMKPKAPSLEDFKHISKVISLENQKSIQKMQKDFDKVITDKNEGISRLKDHNKKLLMYIKKSKDRKHCV